MMSPWTTVAVILRLSLSFKRVHACFFPPLYIEAYLQPNRSHTRQPPHPITGKINPAEKVDKCSSDWRRQAPFRPLSADGKTNRLARLAPAFPGHWGEGRVEPQSTISGETTWGISNILHVARSTFQLSR